MTMEEAASYNVPEEIERQNEVLGHTERGTVAEWLSGDEIIELVAIDNPDNNALPNVLGDAPAYVQAGAVVY